MFHIKKWGRGNDDGPAFQTIKVTIFEADLSITANNYF